MTYNLQLKLTACRDVVVAVAVAVVVVDVDVAVAVADGGAVPVILVLDLMKYFYVLCSMFRKTNRKSQFYLFLFRKSLRLDSTKINSKIKFARLVFETSSSSSSLFGKSFSEIFELLASIKIF